MIASDFQIHAEKMFPLVTHLGLNVKNLSPEICVLEGQWAANKNHVGTVFGGSLYCFTALSCYGLLWSTLTACQMMTQNIVIGEGRIRYVAPVGGNFEVRCAKPAESEIKNFLSGLKKKSVARIGLKAEVLWRNKVCAEFNGEYIAKN